MREVHVHCVRFVILRSGIGTHSETDINEEFYAYAKPKPSPPSLMASSSCWRSISYDEYCGRSIWLKPARKICQPRRSRTRDLSVRLTSVRLRETVGVAVCFVYRETLSALDALELDEATERYARSTRREAEHLRPLLAVERLECAPEPNDDGI